MAFFRPTKVSLTKGPKQFVENFFQALGEDHQNGEERSSEPFYMLDEEQVNESELTSANTSQDQTTKHLIRDLVIKESSLTLSICGLFSNHLLDVRDLIIPIEEFRLNNEYHIIQDHESHEKYANLAQSLCDEPALPIEDVKSLVNEFYKKKFLTIGNQNKMAVLSSLEGVQRLTCFGNTLMGPLYMPIYRAYQFGPSGFEVGLQEGCKEL